AIAANETSALVGASACGKPTRGRIAAGSYQPEDATVRLRGKPVMSGGRRPRKITTKVQTVFQDPFASLNPRMRVGDIVAEGPLAHRLVDRGRATTYATDWLARVGLDAEHASRYPHQ